MRHTGRRGMQHIDPHIPRMLHRKSAQWAPERTFPLPSRDHSQKEGLSGLQVQLLIRIRTYKSSSSDSDSAFLAADHLRLGQLQFHSSAEATTIRNPLLPKLDDDRRFEHTFIAEAKCRLGLEPKQRSGELKKAVPVSPSSPGSRFETTLSISVYKVKPRLRHGPSSAEKVCVHTIVIEHVAPHARSRWELTGSKS